MFMFSVEQLEKTFEAYSEKDLEKENTQLPNTGLLSKRWRRGLVILRLFGTSLVPLTAACGTQSEALPYTGISSVVKPGMVNNPSKPERVVDTMLETPEGRVKSLLKSIISGNYAEYVKNFPKNDVPGPEELSKEKINMYKNCNIEQASFHSRVVPGDEIEVITDFKEDCIETGSKKFPRTRYVGSIVKKIEEDTKKRYIIMVSSPSSGSFLTAKK